jgi:hypothetical protein
MNDLEVVGSVLTIVMGINGFFLKSVYSDMQFLKIELGKLIIKHDNTTKEAMENSREIYKLRERVHSLESGQSQLIKHFEDSHGR